MSDLEQLVLLALLRIGPTAYGITIAEEIGRLNSLKPLNALNSNGADRRSGARLDAKDERRRG